MHTHGAFGDLIEQVLSKDSRADCSDSSLLPIHLPAAFDVFQLTCAPIQCIDLVDMQITAASQSGGLKFIASCVCNGQQILVVKSAGARSRRLLNEGSGFLHM